MSNRFSYVEADKDLKPTQTRIVKQGEMTSECWMVQFKGLEACKTCQYKNKRSACGGMKIRETGKNSKGFTVPLGKPQ